MTADQNDNRHTPGPWVISVSNVFRVIALKDGEPYRVIVKDTYEEGCWYGQKLIGWLGSNAQEEAAANARLIAAAPEMFEALAKIANLNYSKAATNGAAYDAVQIAKEAIEKSEVKGNQ